MTTTRARLILTVLATTLIGVAGASPSSAEESFESADNGVVIRLKGTASVKDVTAAFPVEVDHPLLASRGIYLLTVTDPTIADDSKKTADLAKMMDRFPSVDFAEPNYSTRIADSRYHSWPEGTPVDAGTDPTEWRTQPVSEYLNLSAAHEISTGVGSVVAVLDTGSDLTHPALSGRLLAGYDYVDDDSDPTDEPQRVDTNHNGIYDEAYGHGTFVAGTVLFVAPEAEIMPMRVLDSDGVGNVFVLAEAISDAAAGGADVINLSLGTSAKSDSKLLDKVIKDVQKSGVVVVAAAGNANSQSREYPAQNKNVLAVASSTSDGAQLSEFSNWGEWVSVAAPADHVLGPVPGGGYAWWAGTSVATPQVSGQVALIRTQGLDPKKELEAVTKHTTKIDSKKYGKKIKHGSIDLLDSLTSANRRK